MCTQIKHATIILIVVSINGLVHKESTKWIKNTFKQRIDWNTVFPNLVVRNMKTIMYYNGINMDCQIDDEGQQAALFILEPFQSQNIIRQITLK